MTPVTIGLLVYLGIVLAIGVLSGRRARSGSSHAIASHRAGPWRVAASLFALLGGGELVTMVSLSYSYSYAAMWFFGGIALGFVTLVFVTPRIRTDDRVQRLTGLPDFFREYFGPSAGTAATVIVALAFFSLLMIQYTVGASLLATLLGWPYPIVVLAMSAVIVAYLSSGGYEAVLNTDVLQAIVMLLTAAVIVAVFAGLEPVVASAIAPEPMSSAVGLLFFVPAWLAVVGSADIWQILFAANSQRTARVGLLAAASGFIAYGVFLSHLGNLVRAAEPSLQVPDEAFGFALANVFPPYLQPVGIILVFAAVMSTADTEIFVVTRAVVREVFARGKQTLDLDREKRATQAGISYVAIAGAGAAIVGATSQSLTIVYFCVVALALALTPPIIAAWRFRVPEGAVIAALIASPLSLAVGWSAGVLGPTSAPLISLCATTVTLIVAAALLRPKKGRLIP